MLDILRKSAARRRFVGRLQEQLVARARAPVFFRAFAVPDSIDGRFDLMALHAWLVLGRLKEAGMDDAAQGLTDAIFTDFDEALREQGAGDMSIGRRMKAIADAFYGRLRVYGAAGDVPALAAALARNLYRGGRDTEQAHALAAYAFEARAALAAASLDAGELDFGPLPQPLQSGAAL